MRFQASIPAATSRRPALLPLLLALTCAPAVAADMPGHGLGLAFRDTTCSPCRDFFQYSNGAWMAKAEIPASYSAYGANEELEDRNQAALHDLLEDAVKQVTKTPAGSNMRRLGLYYGSCMDSTRAEALGMKPLEPELARIAAITNTAQLTSEIAGLHDAGYGALFFLFANQDYRNSEQFIAWAYQGGLGLPDRDYYTRTDSSSLAMLQAYRGYVGTMLRMIGRSEGEAAAGAGRVLAIESALARASMTRVERRNPKAVANKMSVGDLMKICPGFGWRDYLKQSQLAAVESLNVAQPLFFRGVDSLLKVVPIEDWKTYLSWRLIDQASPRLSSAFVNANFDFHRRLTGATEILPRWKRCLAETDGALGEALGQEYVRIFFPPAAKKRALEMVQNLETTLEGRLGRLSWMNDSTRREAVTKLHAFRNKIGYPDKWRDYSSMKLTAGAWYENAVAADRFESRRQLARIAHPIDRTEWRMTPPTVNAYYSPSMNEIVFPAGILQPPFFFFDPGADDAVNYGATGATIGHEMTHGFDDSGRQFDARGNLRDWWTTTDESRYKEAAEKVVQQFNGYVAVDTLHVNGRLTLGENIADLGGLVIAYEAFEKSRAGKPATLVDGLTPEQRFFIAYGQSWRWIWRPERTRRLVLTDPHAPPKWRVNGPLENMPEFAKAFGCKAGDPMVRSDSDRAVIW